MEIRAAFGLLMGLLALASANVVAEARRERLPDNLVHHDAGASEDADDGRGLSCAEWSKRVRRLERLAARRHRGPVPDFADLAYGPEPLARLDVHAPQGRMSVPAPVIFMVHGGGWCVGDKAGASMTANKVARWVPRGFLFVSANYPMVADGADALAQAAHVARAVAYVQAHAAQWGGDPARVILMGHSAGAHLVSLVNADADIRAAQGVRPILGTISLDAGALDVVTQMPKVYPFLKLRYREAFGTQEAQWQAASPYHRLRAGASPWLGVCSTQRRDRPCDQAAAYASKSRGLGIPAAVQSEDRSHAALNRELGLPGPYTARVEAFMAGLDPQVARLLKD